MLSVGGNKMKNISLSTLLLITIVLFLIAIYALLIQVFGIQSGDKATIIGGLLSMIGGIVGALGAYFVASMQIEKQFAKQDKDRVIELKILKLNETLELANEFLHILQVWRGLTYNVEIRVKQFKEKKLTHVNELNIFNDNEQQDIKKNIQKLVFAKDTLKKNKVFLSGITDLQEIFNLTSGVVESNKKLLNSFNIFKTKQSLRLADLGPEFDEVVFEVGNNYKELDKEIRNVITLIECSMKDLLEF